MKNKVDEIRHKKNKERYDWLKEHNICTKCGQANAIKNQTLCIDCAVKARERTYKWYANLDDNTRKKYREKYRKERYYKLKEQGICTRCGKRKIVNSETLCDWCLKKQSLRNHKRYLRNVYETRNINNIRV